MKKSPLSSKSKSPSQVSTGIFLGCLCWIIAYGIYLFFDPNTVISFSLTYGKPLHADSLMWLFSFLGLLSFLTALKKFLV
jgi:hypothetical protein